MNWTFDPTDYKENDFKPIPEGDYRVRISDVVEKVFRSGKEGFEITLEVNGHKGKVWHYLVLDPSNREATNQRIGALFNSFGIADNNLANYRTWIGKVGGARLKHEEFNGDTTVKVRFFLNRAQTENLPAWQNGGTSPAAAVDSVDIDDLPF